MTNKTTKRALLASIVSLVLCFTMLLGTTYAWFTDSASTAVNTIQSGNLDMGVYWATPADIVDGDIPEGSWKPMEADKSVFNQDALWEPGYTEVVFFKFVNEGSLAFQYQFNVDILKEVIGKTNDGADIQLSKYIQAYACNCFSWDYTNYLFASNEAATNPVGAPDPFHTTLFDAANGAVATPSGDNPLSLDSWQWLDFEETTYATLVLWMPTTVGNEANHNGTDKPSIDLGINVLATQYTYEKDSFGDQYDKDAEYPELIPTITDLAGLREAMANGGEYKLGATINVASTELLYQADGGHSDGSAFLIKADMVLDLNGYDIVVDAPSYASDVFFVNGGHNFTVKGDGTVTGDCGIFVAYDSATTINIEGGNYKCTANNDMLYAIWGKLNVSGGTYETAYWNLINIYGQGNISLVDVSGGSFKNWNPAASPDGNLLADGYKVTSEVIDGATWYTVVAE